MAEHAHEHVHIDADPAACLAVALDIAQYPDWAKDVKSVEVRATDDHGRATEAEFRAAAMGRSIRYVLRYDYAQLPDRFSWTFVEGEMLRQLDGTYTFTAEPGGTRVDYELVADMTSPLPGIVKRRAAGMITSTALKELKRAVEQK
ncbi:MAG: SRPBCC family protein [Acidimicrobiia bacterium]